MKVKKRKSNHLVQLTLKMVPKAGALDMLSFNISPTSKFSSLVMFLTLGLLVRFGFAKLMHPICLKAKGTFPVLSNKKDKP